jgi:hypothetical protein
MSYLLLIVQTPEQRQTPPEVGRGRYQRMLDYARRLEANGVLLASEALRSSAARLVSRDGRAIVTDGPFAEAKEVVGGFFLLDCATREQALALAAECPATEWASIEVRETGPCTES